MNTARTAAVSTGREGDGRSARTSPRRGWATKARVVAVDVALTLLIALGTSVSPEARAADGCLVLLCLAAPSWSSIAQCVDPVRSVLRDMARGHPFPTCDMSGGGNQASNQMAAAPTFCPPQYSHEDDRDTGPIYSCDYTGAVDVEVGGALWSRTWWNPGGDSVTEFSDAAKAQMNDWDTRFDDDYARWLAAQPAPVQNTDPQGG